MILTRNPTAAYLHLVSEESDGHLGPVFLGFDLVDEGVDGGHVILTIRRICGSIQKVDEAVFLARRRLHHRSLGSLVHGYRIRTSQLGHSLVESSRKMHQPGRSNLTSIILLKVLFTRHVGHEPAQFRFFEIEFVLDQHRSAKKQPLKVSNKNAFFSRRMCRRLEM